VIRLFALAVIAVAVDAFYVMRPEKTWRPKQLAAWVLRITNWNGPQRKGRIRYGPVNKYGFELLYTDAAW